MTAPRLSIVHDYLTQRGGAERVVLAMSDAFVDAPIYTSLYDPATTYPSFAERDVRASPINRVPALRRDHRLALPLLGAVFSRLHAPGDLVLCSSSGWAHGARTEGRKVVYCHSPAKWLYAADRYFGGAWPATRHLARLLERRDKRWDRAAAATADHYVVNSTMVQRWVREVYDRDAEVVAPPRGVEPDGHLEPVPGIAPGFLLCVSRLIAYKNVRAVVAAVADLPDQHLVVVGTGPLEQELRASATSNVTFVGRVGDGNLRWLYRHSTAVVAAAFEDFGLTPPEAAAFGKPVAVLRWGGFLDTVAEGTTGVFFDLPERTAIRGALRELVTVSWDEAAIRAHAEAYAPITFRRQLHRVVEEQSRLAT